MPSRDNPRMKIVFSTSDEYFAVTGAIRNIFAKDAGWTAKFSADLLAKIETDYDAEDSGEGGKPSVILEDTVVEQALPLLIAAASKLSSDNSAEKVEDLKNTNAALSAESKILEAEKAKLSADNSSLKDQIKDLSQQIADLKVNQSSQSDKETVDSLKKALEAAKAKEKDLLAKINDLSSRVTALNGDGRSTAQVMDENLKLQAKIRELSANVTAGIDQIGNLRETVRKLTADKNSAERAVNDANTKLSQMEDRISKYVAENSTLRAEKDKLQLDSAAANDNHWTISRLRQELQEERSRNDVLRLTIADLNSQLEEADPDHKLSGFWR